VFFSDEHNAVCKDALEVSDQLYDVQTDNHFGGVGVIFSVPYPTEARMMPVDAMSWDNSATFGRQSAWMGHSFARRRVTVSFRLLSPRREPFGISTGRSAGFGVSEYGVTDFLHRFGSPPVRASNMHFVRG
jgi:hypothetical protein